MVELPLYRWWTDGFSLPVEVEILKYCGAATWQIRFPNGTEPEVDEEELYSEELDAIYDFLDKTKSVADAIETLEFWSKRYRQDLGLTIATLKAERAIANSGLEEKR